MKPSYKSFLVCVVICALSWGLAQMFPAEFRYPLPGRAHRLLRSAFNRGMAAGIVGDRADSVKGQDPWSRAWREGYRFGQSQ